MPNGARDPIPGLHLLSLDGGIIRGISTLHILQSLMKHIRRHENIERRRWGQTPLKGLPKPCDVFDLIGGTNSGGIIALLLGRLELSVEDALECFNYLMERILQPHHVTPETRSLVLEHAMKQLVWQETGDANERLLHEETLCHVFVCARNERNMNAGVPVLFRTYHSPHTHHEDCTIVQSAGATFSTPGLFPATIVGNGQRYVDGGLGCNNPTKLVLSEASELFPGRLVASITSVGTGHPETINLTNSTHDRILLQMAHDCESVHEAMSSFLLHHPGLYRRFSVEQGMQGINTTQLSEVAVFEAHTHAYLLRMATKQNLSQTAVAICAWEGSIPVEHLVAAPILRADAENQPDEREIALEMETRRRSGLGTRVPTPSRHTRQDVGIIDAWLNPQASLDSKRLLWIHGPPHSGKSTLAVSIVDKLRNNGTTLVAQLFISRNLPDTTNPSNFFPAIATQLCGLSPNAISVINYAVNRGPPSSFVEQVNTFLLAPVCELAKTRELVVVFIDGLDALQHSVGQVTTALSLVNSHLPVNARIIVTSRSDINIVTVFGGKSWM